MSRIRSIKPDFWTSEQILECSRNARLLFIGLWNFCDDDGRHPYSARQAKAEVFPGDDLNEAEVGEMLSELERADLIRRYESGGKQFFFVTGWKHQRIDKPQSPKYPDPFADNSKIIPGTLQPDRIGEDRKGKEGEDRPTVADATRRAVDEKFEKFKKVYPSRGPASNPWKPAKEVYDRHLKNGEEPESLAIAAEIYARRCDEQKISGTDKVAQAVTWLRQERFRDYFDGMEAELSRRKTAEADMAQRGYVWDGSQWRKKETAA